MSEISQPLDVSPVKNKKQIPLKWIILFLVAVNVLISLVYKPLEPEISIPSESVLFHIENEQMIKDPWFTLPVVGDVYLTNSLTSTFLAIIILLILAWQVHRQTSKGQLKTHGVVLGLELIFSGLASMADNAVEEKWRSRIYSVFYSIFLYIMVINLCKLLPFYETIGVVHPVAEHGFQAEQWTSWLTALVRPAPEGEQGYRLLSFFRGSSTDLNFTLAIAIVTVVIVQIYGISARGIGYFNKFFNVRAIIKHKGKGLIDFIVSLLEGISEIAKIASFGFRLFGNMFAGSVLLLILSFMVPWLLGSFIMLYEVFVGLLQAFIFAMLATVFMSMAVQTEENH
jgi:F-type H+-transporting ATPase subunit a